MIKFITALMTYIVQLLLLVTGEEIYFTIYNITPHASVGNAILVKITQLYFLIFTLIIYYINNKKAFLFISIIFYCYTYSLFYPSHPLKGILTISIMYFSQSIGYITLNKIKQTKMKRQLTKF